MLAAGDRAVSPTTVRLFASLREAAGRDQLVSEAATVRQLVEQLRGRFGSEFADRLAQATVVVDGDVEARDSERPLAEVEEVALLPPFSGG